MQSLPAFVPFLFTSALLEGSEVAHSKYNTPYLGSPTIFPAPYNKFYGIKLKKRLTPKLISPYLEKSRYVQRRSKVSIYSVFVSAVPIDEKEGEKLFVPRDIQSLYPSIRMSIISSPVDYVNMVAEKYWFPLRIVKSGDFLKLTGDFRMKRRTKLTMMVKNAYSSKYPTRKVLLDDLLSTHRGKVGSSIHRYNKYVKSLLSLNK